MNCQLAGAESPRSISAPGTSGAHDASDRIYTLGIAPQVLRRYELPWRNACSRSCAPGARSSSPRSSGLPATRCSGCDTGVPLQFLICPLSASRFRHLQAKVLYSRMLAPGARPVPIPACRKTGLDGRRPNWSKRVGHCWLRVCASSTPRKSQYSRHRHV
jgi:hypothetical protein